MNPVRAFFAKHVAILVLVAFAVLMLALATQTVRLSAAQTDLAQLEAKVAQDEATRQEARADDEKAARDKEKEILERAAKTKKADDEKIRTLSADAARLERLLRDRPMRPGAGGQVAGDSATAGSGGGGRSGATGAELYAQDGAVLVGESERAQRILIQRDSCIRQYLDAREALKAQKPRK